jgi:UMF1 family MFS transporter
MATTARQGRNAALSWALYDWANSAFALMVVSVFFPVFLKQYWSTASDATATTLQLGVANSIAAFVVAGIAPVLGAIADGTGTKKRSLAAFTLVAIGATAALALVDRGESTTALILFVIASIGFAAAGSFYDALLPDMAGRDAVHSLSAFGFGLGYLGGGLLFTFIVAMTVWPSRFGLTNSEQAIQLAFPLVATWWLLFSIPLMLNVNEPRPAGGAGAEMSFVDGLRRVTGTLRELRSHRAVWMFLVAYWCYIDGVYTMARMAVDYGLDLGFSSASLVAAILLTQLVGFPASLLFGRLAGRCGARALLFTGIGTYIVASAWSFRMTEAWEFYVLALIIGLVQGGVQSLSRSIFTGLVPAGRSGEFFGFFNMSGRLSAVFGPAAVGVVGWSTGNPRLAVIVILLLFVAGAGLLALTTGDDSDGTSNRSESSD